MGRILELEPERRRRELEHLERLGWAPPSPAPPRLGRLELAIAVLAGLHLVAWMAWGCYIWARAGGG